ncbi:GIY-YIG nuclease family protein [Peptoniphilus sp. KCTC 25270]|uniref:GIY-YIG nuclease family protein n=1 Tax=Peptoniphilus sp. KCTC 25270 TaxID=2897414 RepID=UPI00351D2D65
MYVYILASPNRNALYVGVTKDLERRMYEHKNKLHDGHTSKYNIVDLVYYEEGGDSSSAIEREKQIKHWSRSKKEALISGMNPDWRDLSEDWWRITRGRSFRQRPSQPRYFEGAKRVEKSHQGGRKPRGKPLEMRT